MPKRPRWLALPVAVASTESSGNRKVGISTPRISPRKGTAVSALEESVKVIVKNAATARAASWSEMNRFNLRFMMSCCVFFARSNVANAARSNVKATSLQLLVRHRWAIRMIPRALFLREDRSEPELEGSGGGLSEVQSTGSECPQRLPVRPEAKTLPSGPNWPRPGAALRGAAQTGAASPYLDAPGKCAGRCRSGRPKP